MIKWNTVVEYTGCVITVGSVINSGEGKFIIIIYTTQTKRLKTHEILYFVFT